MLRFNGGRIESVTVALFVRVLEVPVMVTVKVPMLAAPLAVKVSVLVLVVLAGLNDAVTPLGKPEADKFTLALKPFCGVTVIVLVPLAAWKTLKLLGDADSVKLPTLFTVRETVVELVKRPAVPVMVTFVVPIGAVPLAVNVNVLVLAVLVGLNAAVMPLGSPEADKLTLLLNPFRGTTLIVLVPVPPCVMVTLLGDVERIKPGLGPFAGQLFTKLFAFSVPMPVAKSHPVVVPYVGLKILLEVESTPCVPAPEGLKQLLLPVQFTSMSP
jgi:hypothetical protein